MMTKHLLFLYRMVTRLSVLQKVIILITIMILIRTIIIDMAFGAQVAILEAVLLLQLRDAMNMRLMMRKC